MLCSPIDAALVSLESSGGKILARKSVNPPEDMVGNVNAFMIF
jgi:hypothetical protein